MSVGIVCKWIASGQAVVARQIRSALDELGHETFVLARPGSGPRAAGGRRGRASTRSGTSPASPRLRARDARRRVRGLGAGELARADPLRRELPVGRGRVPARGRASARSGASSGSTSPPSTSSRAKARLRRRLLAAPRRARPLRRDGDRVSPYVQWGIHPELLEPASVPSADDEPRHLLLPGLASSAAASRSARSIKAFGKARGRAPAAARSTPRSRATTRSCTSGPRPTRGSS